MSMGIQPGPGLSYGSTRTYATLNPADKNSQISLSNGNLTATCNTAPATNVMARATIGISSGKWYWESTATYTGGSESVEAGLANASASVSGYCGQDTNSAGSGYYGDGKAYYNNAVVANLGTVASGSYMGHRYDASTGTLQTTLDGSTWTTIHAGFTGAMYPAIDCARTTSIITMNFGQNPFHFSVPSGYNAGVYT